MAAAQGFTEVFNYSFLSEEQVRAFGLDPAEHVQVANPIASDQNLLRASLLPGILRNVLDNARNFESFRLFEIGKEIHPDREVPHFAAALYAKDDGVAGLLELKRVAECLLGGVVVRPAAPRAYEHPQRAADVLYEETRIGRLFEFHPRMVEIGRAAVLDLDLTVLEKLQSATPTYRALRRYPTSAFDLSVVVPGRTLSGDVEAQLVRLAGDALVAIAFLREFKLPDGSRSLSYRLTVGSNDRTLASEEAGAIRARIIDGMHAAGFELKV